MAGCILVNSKVEKVMKYPSPVEIQISKIFGFGTLLGNDVELDQRGLID